MVLAPPAASAPPASTSTISDELGNSPAARIIAGTVVTSSSSITRGLVSRKYAFATVNVRRIGEAAAPTAALRPATSDVSVTAANLAVVPAGPRSRSGAAG